jgi:hypothetical protein
VSHVNDEPGITGATSSMMRHVSKTTVIACVVLFIAGVVGGAIAYLDRSPVAEKQVSGTNAIPVHIVLGLVAAALVVGLPRLRLANRAPYSMWVAPFSQLGFSRFKRTILLRSGTSPANVLRADLAGMVAIVMLYNFFRAGVQVIGGLDRNFTVNAWGGPSYLGAMAAHYLDGAYLFYAAALLLNLLACKSTK